MWGTLLRAPWSKVMGGLSSEINESKASSQEDYGKEDDSEENHEEINKTENEVTKAVALD